jgi:hypothetical protein
MNKLRLTNTVQRRSDGFPVHGSISQCGRYAYCVYPINESCKDDVIAEFFDIRDGLLYSTNQQKSDIDHLEETEENMWKVNSGSANFDFTRFSIVDDDQSGISIEKHNKQHNEQHDEQHNEQYNEQHDEQHNEQHKEQLKGCIRIRIYDNHFKLLKTRDDIVYAVGERNKTYSVTGGNFSRDGKYIMLTYLIGADLEKQKTRIHILKSFDLTDVAIQDIDGSTFGGEFIQMNGKTFVVIAIQNGTFQFGFNTEMESTLSEIKLFLIKKSKFKQVDRSRLPQIINANGLVVRMTDCGTKALIGASTRRAIKTTSLFKKDSNNRVFDNSGKEMRIYVFDGTEMKKVMSKKTDSTMYGPIFYPKDEILLINQQLSEQDPCTFDLYDCSLRRKTKKLGTYFAPPMSRFRFSETGKWLLVTGSDKNKKINNINLYYVDVNVQKNINEPKNKRIVTQEAIGQS